MRQKMHPSLTEFQWLHALSKSTLTRVNRRKTNFHQLVIPPGDDCAEIRLGKAPFAQKKAPKYADTSVLFAADMLMDGVHFDLQKIHPYWAGSKAVRVNLSDIAAMGGTPLTITVSLALPKTRGHEIAEAVMAGIAETCEAFETTIAGGDTNSWDGPLVISISILGRPSARGSIERKGARPGDRIFVSGPLGGSLPSGRHLAFKPRLELAKFLTTHFKPHAMLDLSDGLGSDLHHVLRLSQVGAILTRHKLPLHPDLALTPELIEKKRLFFQKQPRSASLFSSNTAPLEFAISKTKKPRTKAEKDRLIARALSDGEDFELCWILSPKEANALQAMITKTGARSASTTIQDKTYFEELKGIVEIGVITEHCEKLIWDDGTPILSKGFEHRLDNGLKTVPPKRQAKHLAKG